MSKDELNPQQREFYENIIKVSTEQNKELDGKIAAITQNTKSTEAAIKQMSRAERENQQIIDVAKKRLGIG